MAEAARRLDLIDVRPAFTAAHAAALETRFAGADAAALAAHRAARGAGRQRRRGLVVRRGIGGSCSTSSAQADPATPVLFVDTLKMFPRR